jgi:lipopolysaccharide biosynthesis glycosyltransferase
VPDVEDRHHVVVACDDIFAMPLAATVASACRATADATRLQFTVIDCGLSARNRQRIRRSVERHGSRITIVPFASAIPAQALRAGTVPSTATYARLFVADHLPGATRALYLDADVIVRCDVADVLAQLDPTALLAGVPDQPGDSAIGDIERLAAHLPAGRDGTYVNAGVMCLNLQRFRDEGVSEQCRDLLATGTFALGDQDVINLVCAGQTQALPRELNVQTHLLAELPDEERRLQFEQAKILHYTLRPKPWHGHGTPRSRPLVRRRRLDGLARMAADRRRACSCRRSAGWRAWSARSPPAGLSSRAVAA